MIKHPARFNQPIIDAINMLLPAKGTLLDPFAGVGSCLQFATPERYVVGIELEPEWVCQAPVTPYGMVLVGNALCLPFADDTFDMACTSPTYGNRMADHHNARDTSKRLTYRHTLGRELTTHNSGALQWGPEYREFHQQAWLELRRVLKMGAIFILNIKNHIRHGVVQNVVAWHEETFTELGFRITDRVAVPCGGMRYGANYQQRVDNEFVIRFELDAKNPNIKTRAREGKTIDAPASIFDSMESESAVA